MREIISIKYDDDNKVRVRFFGSKDGDGWTRTRASEWPESDPSDNETHSFYYDESTGEITVKYSQKKMI